MGIWWPGDLRLGRSVHNVMTPALTRIKSQRKPHGRRGARRDTDAARALGASERRREEPGRAWDGARAGGRGDEGAVVIIRRSRT